MHNSLLFPAPTVWLRRCCLLSIIVLLFSCIPTLAFSQEDPVRQHAFELFRDGKFVEALPLFEQLEKKYPQDAQVLEAYGFVLFGQSSTLATPVERKDIRRRARELLVRAQKAGAANPLLSSMIEGIPPDGGNDVAFSSKKEVDEAMREGEAAFAKGDYAKAVEMYQRALLLDPNTYEAALFTGDVYFKSADQRKAGEWFARAVSINPNRETAYRYWGDSLMKQARVTEAGDKFVEAYIAEPYNRLTTAALVNWANKVSIQLAHPNVKIPTGVASQQNGNMAINIDPNTLKDDDKSGSGAAWITYGLVRATWGQGEFTKHYPNEKQYRHSLNEEIAALRAAVKVVAEQKNVDPEKIDPSLKVIAKLDKEGLLEAYVLLAMRDAGIAQDFAAYRKSNIAKLRQYVMDYVMTGGEGKN